MSTNEVATRDNSPAGLVRQYSTDFTQLLPTHVKADTWVRLATGALRKGKTIRTPEGNRYELEVAANNNPAAFLGALKEAARLGLDPGTEQFYLTPRKVKGQTEILGIVGWQGYVELMYRAGAISSVVAEVVYTNDEFSFRPGRDERPDHEVNWDSDDRGPLRLVYAYAVMKGGATSKVVVLNRAAISKIKASAQGASSEYSPWNTHEASMWLKSAVRQLAKWVPTSSEYRREILRAASEVAAESQPAAFGPAIPDLNVDTETGEVYDAEVIDEDPS